MKITNNLLIGKWKFIGAEHYSNSKWSATNNFVKEMTWDFQPQFFGSNKIIGTIVEQAPLPEEAIGLNFSYTDKSQLLTIEVFTDTISGPLDESEADLYELTASEESTVDRPIIIASIINQRETPPPYVRYILQKVSL